MTDKPPFLLMHVAHVELEKQATSMAQAYRENGGEFEVALLPREPILSQPRGAGWALIAFLQRVTGGD